MKQIRKQKPKAEHGQGRLDEILYRALVAAGKMELAKVLLNGH